jgi:hypothetical protein
MNKENLAKLRDFLKDNLALVNKHFAMGAYYSAKNALGGFITADDLACVQNANMQCGSSACAVGWAPHVIEVVESDFKVGGDFHYNTFAERALAKPLGDEWNWMFSGAWEFVDDTAEGAVYRISTMLERGIPYGDYPRELLTYSRGELRVPYPYSFNNWTGEFDTFMEIYLGKRDEWLAANGIKIPE